jgi:hypothetical protein
MACCAKGSIRDAVNAMTTPKAATFLSKVQQMANRGV